MSRLRDLRLKRGNTLKDVSEATGYTKSFISQLERGLKKPSIDSLRKIADYLEVPVATLLEEPENAPETSAGCTVILPEERKNFQLSKDSSVLCEMLTPNSGGGLEGCLCTIGPGESSSGQQVSHIYAECTYVLEGTMTALIEQDEHIVPAGASIYIEPNTLHNFFNKTEKALKLLMFYDI